MTTSQAPALYPQDQMEELLEALSSGGGADVIDAALAACPEDPRLHFLRGSVLAGERRYDEARQAMGHAVELAPDYAIARFQLGFLQFTSGNVVEAAQAWDGLQSLPSEHALRLFAEGLMRLPADDVQGAVALLRKGIDANGENPALNRDMQMLIDELLRAGETPPEDEPTSETQLLLRQLGGTRH